MENLTPKLHYATWLDGDPARACVDPQRIADALPHGSGIDGNWHITVLRNGDVQVSGEYHAMDDNGMYCGWRGFKFTVRKARKLESNALTGPCAGKVQVLKRPGDIYLDSFRGGADAGDYLYESVECSLSDAGLLTQRSEVVDAAQADSVRS